jgi:hypothetical protein
MFKIGMFDKLSQAWLEVLLPPFKTAAEAQAKIRTYEDQDRGNDRALRYRVEKLGAGDGT